MPRFPIVMKVWAGDEPHDLEYIGRSLPSLLASDLPEGAEIVIYDDCSPNPRIRPLLEDIARRDARVRLHFGEVNRGPNWGQEHIYSVVEAEYPEAPCYVNVDDDVVYHRRWLRRLWDAWERLAALGIEGVYTALDMPFRPSEATVEAAGQRFHLKWKQPALNWLIPRSVYDAVGRFDDEGIAYDTVYSHWMRLKGYPVVCMTPSYVQNIGLLGAYAEDDTTTSPNFVGEGEGDGPARRLVHAARYTLNRLPDRVRAWTDSAPARYGPIRWGTDFVFDGRTRAGESRALFAPLDGLGAASDQQAVLDRVEDLRRAQGREAFGVLGPHFDRHGTLKWVESEWRFLPNLRELRRLGLSRRLPGPRALLTALARQLAPLHAAGVVHNKLRQDNVYLDGGDEGAAPRLAWLGSELPVGSWADGPPLESVGSFSGALNRWARPETRERFAAEYLEAVAPELLEEGAPTFASDVYGAAAVTVLAREAPPKTLAAVQERQRAWSEGRLPDALAGEGLLAGLLRRCLQRDPAQRPADAAEVLQALG